MKKEKIHFINSNQYLMRSVLGFLIVALNFIYRILVSYIICFCLCLNTSSAQNNDTHNSTKTSDGSNFTKLFDFENFTSGSLPSELIKSGNFLYGVTINGGPNGANGMLYKIKTDGTEPDGIPFYEYYIPNSLTIIDTMVYGIVYDGKGFGAEWHGIMYRVSINGNGFGIIHYFDDTNYPEYIIAAHDNTIYGSAFGRFDGIRYLFRIDLDGSNFQKFQSVGYFPYGKLILEDNYLYGTTADVFGPAEDHGTIYKIKQDGTDFRELHRFDSVQGRTPATSLIVLDSFLYGTTRWGGIDENGVIFKIKTDGTDFQVLHKFLFEEGAGSFTKLVYSGKSLYGTGAIGGIYDHGTLFRIDPDGTDFEKLYDFQGADGSRPGDLIIANDTIWGITDYGGINDDGTIFRYVIDEPQITPVEPPPIFTLSISKPEEISIETKKEIIVDNNSIIDLDTTFTVEGNIPYTHSWNILSGNNFIEIDKKVNINQNSIFYLIIITAEGCTYSDSITVQAKNVTGIEESKISENQIIIYPNPNFGMFQIEIAEGFANYEYSIFDISGRKVVNGNINCKTYECLEDIKLKDFKSGVYTIILTKNGLFYNQQKLIISRL